VKCGVLECENLQESRGMCIQHIRRFIQKLVYENEDGVLVDHCQNDHELAGDNVRWEPSGAGSKRRRCRACLRARGRNQARTKLAQVEPPEPFRPDDEELSQAISDFEEAKAAVDAKCRDNPGPYMDWEKPPTPAEARALCAGCPLLQACGNYRIAAQEWHGIWGGVIVNEGVVIK
jgi:hypothetical protein